MVTNFEGFIWWKYWKQWNHYELVYIEQTTLEKSKIWIYDFHYEYKKQPPEVFYRNCRTAGLRHRCFPVNFAKHLRIPFLQNTSERLLLEYMQSKCDSGIRLCYMTHIAWPYEIEKHYFYKYYTEDLKTKFYPSGYSEDHNRLLKIRKNKKV